jgi:TetR/AcrR family transcriptional repressor of mexJK operon
LRVNPAKAGERRVSERSRAKGLQIIEAAGRLFLEQGYGATSMDAIAREAGVSKATLYAHYTGKDELFTAMIAMGTAQHSAALTDLDLGAPEDLRAQLLRIARNHVDLLLSPQGLGMYRVVLAEVSRFPELGRAFYEGGVRVKHALLVDYLTRADAGGALRIDQPRRAAAEFFGMVGSHLQMHAMLGLGVELSQEDRDAIVGHAVDTFLRAYRR